MLFGCLILCQGSFITFGKVTIYTQTIQGMGAQQSSVQVSAEPVASAPQLNIELKATCRPRGIY